MDRPWSPLILKAVFLSTCGFVMGLWLSENQFSPEEKASKRFKWEFEQKLKLDQEALKEAKQS